MAGHEWDWFQREELIGHISDIRVQNLQVERENVQKRTFTRWMNLHLEKCCPPLEVKDLFVDIQDGKILMALLEVLTGQRLLHEYKSSAHRIFRLNNIAKALKFLEDSNVKLVSIDAAEIADGNPSLVLGLIWNIILFLQIKELTGNLNRMSSSSSLSSLPSGTESETSQPSTPSTEKSLSVSIKDQRKAIKALLNWVQQRTRKYGVAVQDFAGSWRSGLAFLAIIKAIDFSLVDIKKALERSSRDNLEDAFNIAEKSLNIPRLLEPEDLMVDSPDEQSIMTYVTQFLEHFPELDADDYRENKREDLPLEMTYVHYKDGPTEEEGTIINVDNNENGNHVMHLDKSHITPTDMHHCMKYSITEEPNIHKNPSPPSTDYKPFPPLERDAKGRFPITNGGGTPKNNFNRSVKTPGTVSADGRKAIVDSYVPSSGDAKEPFYITNGKGPTNDIDCMAESPLSSASAEQELNYEVSDDRFSSLEDISMGPETRPITLFNEDNVKRNNILESRKPDEGRQKLSIISDNGETLSPTTPEEEVDLYKYVLHVAKNSPDSDHPKQNTVFQAHKPSTAMTVDTPDHKGSLQKSCLSTPEPSPQPLKSADTDGADDAKISIIPHDLFYYPHYSVPISDVLQAFVGTSPDGPKHSKAADPSSTKTQEEESETNNGGPYMQTTPEKGKNKGILTTEPEDYPLGTEDGVWEKMSPQIGQQTASSMYTMDKSNKVASRESVDDINSHPSSRFGSTENIQSSERAGGPWKLSDQPTSNNGGLSQGKEFQDIIEQGGISEGGVGEEKLKDPLINKSPCSDTNGNERYIPGQTNFKAFPGESVDRKFMHETEIRKRRVGDVQAAEMDASGFEDNYSVSRSPDMFYAIFLLWVLFYCMLILPELDMSKVAFFSNNE
ncbi:calmin [Spea bombifrons]|uniref:calmin n=1 Tax=Spea bombifrons TaxID=233779 RepID=UPI002349E346|nr:calmin [Spea bombifrons]